MTAARLGFLKSIEQPAEPSGPISCPLRFLNTLWASWDLGTDSLQKTLISYVIFLSCDLNTLSIDSDLNFRYNFYPISSFSMTS